MTTRLMACVDIARVDHSTDKSNMTELEERAFLFGDRLHDQARIVGLMFL